MKKIRALAVILFLFAFVLFLTGCSGGGKGAQATLAPTEEPWVPSGEPTFAPATPSPEPTPTPAPTKAPIADYAYKFNENRDLKVQFIYPSEWIKEESETTISFLEPVAEGQVGARVAVSTNERNKAPGASAMKKQMKNMMESLEGSYDSMKTEVVKQNTRILRTKGYSQFYDAEKDGVQLRGHVVMAYNKNTKRIFMVHFVAPSAQIDQYNVVKDNIFYSVKALKD